MQTNLSIILIMLNETAENKLYQVKSHLTNPIHKSSDIALKSTIKGQSDRYNIKSTIDVCNYQNGTLCNDMNIDNLIGSVRFVTQTASVLKCRMCDSTSLNT